MLAELLNSAEIIVEAYRALADTMKRGQKVCVADLAEEYEHGWLGLRNVTLLRLADQYAERFYGLLSQEDTLDAILDRLHQVDEDYEKMIVTGDTWGDADQTARTSAMALLVILFRRLEARGLVQMWTESEVATWLAEHAPMLGGKHGQLMLL